MKQLNKNEKAWRYSLKKILLGLTMLLGSTIIWQGTAQIVPIKATGYNADVIANGVGSMESSTTDDIDGYGYGFLSEDWKENTDDPDISTGLPADGLISSPDITGLTYQIPTADSPYVGNNSLRIDNYNSGPSFSGDLTLVSPESYAELYFLVTSGAGVSNVDITVHFTDETSQDFNDLSEVPDWYTSGLPVEISDFGRGTLLEDEFEIPDNNPKLYRLEVNIDLINQSKSIENITFTKTNTVGNNSIFHLMGLSGKKASDCLPPYDIIVDVTSVSEATISWSSFAENTEWEVTVQPVGSGIPEEAGESATSSTFTVDNLNPDSTYEVYVRGHCSSANEFSEWQGPVIFSTPLADCEGTPDAGTPDEDSIEICVGVPFTVSVSDASGPANNLYKLWQSSPAGEDDWTDIEDANSNTYSVSEGVDEPTDFRYKVVCNDGDPAYSDIIEVTLKPESECYCTPTYTYGCSLNDRISNVSLLGESNIIDNDSECSEGDYGDYTDLTPADLTPGETYTLSVSTDYNAPINEDVKAWIDYNNNGSFEDDEEIANTQGNGLPNSGTGEFEFTVPENIDPGNYKMRVRLVYSSDSFSPCGNENYGETEDYTVEVIDAETCEGPVTAGEVEDDFNICAGNSFTISVSGASNPANGLLRQWQSSPAGEDYWTVMEGAQANTFSISDGIEESTDFRYVVTCDDDATDTSDILSVTLKPSTECYCTPENNLSALYYISNVSTDNALQNIDNDTEFSDNGYGDYSDTEVIIVQPGQEFSYSITGNDSSMYYGVWLDLNQNGNFDGSSEMIAGSDIAIDAPFTGSYEIPADMEEGDYRLRVRANWVFDMLVGPCEDNTYGETEDYTVQVVFPDCFPPVNAQVDYITNVSAQVNWGANDENSWVVIYGEEGFDPETEVDNVIEVEDIPLADLTDLSEGTAYDVYVKTICEDDESVWKGPINFTTYLTPPENTRLCDAIALAPNNSCIGGPYTNVAAFEEVGEPIGSCHNDYRGKNSVWFNFIASADGEAMITTDFNSTDFTTEIVAFEAPSDCEDMSTLGEEVGCATISDEGILELDGLNSGETYYVKVAGFNNAEGLFCIEVQMDETPLCAAPTNIVFGEIHQYSADISWTAGNDETQWQVTYGEAEFNPETQGNSEIVNTTQITLTDLLPETDYEVYVRAICTNLNSDLAGPEVFTTEPMSVDSQIFADFTFYPNPVQDQLTLKAGSQIEKVDVYNLLGQNVISAKPNSLEAQINTETLQSGVYLMEVSINGSQKSFRVVKK